MAQITIQQAFELATQHHQAGRLREAERLYRQILAHAPEHAEAMNYLGLLLHQSGQSKIAIDLIRRAIAISPASAEAYNNLGMALEGGGQPEEAIAAFRRSISLRPANPEVHSNLGISLAKKGQFNEALAAYRSALALRPDHPEIHFNIGSTLRDNGQFDEAIAAYRQAIALRPNYAKAHSYLAMAMREKGQLDQALAGCRAAIALDPKLPEAHNHLGLILKDKGQPDQAIAAYQQAIALRPGFAEAYCNLSIVFREKGQFDEAIAACRTSLAIKPNTPATLGNLANALKDKREFDEAIAVYRQTIALSPDLAEAHNNLALALLVSGQFEEGWREHEWRWLCKSFPSPRRTFTRPRWNGSPLAGQTILVHAEQGFGDAIQFVRYVPVLAKRGGRVIFECPSELTRLMQRVTGMETIEIITRTKLDDSALPPFEVHAPLMSLPLLLAIPEPAGDFPRPPYIRVEAALCNAWRARIKPSERLKVGLAWAGSLKHSEDARRSISLRALTPLLRSGAELYSLQFGDAAKQNWDGSGLIDLTGESADFLDTAALIWQLDLVICVDTAVAHLAGALGKPAWIMVPATPDWRWQRDREDSPWYPSLKLFRQSHTGEWDEVVTRVAESLEQWIVDSG